MIKYVHAHAHAHTHTHTKLNPIRGFNQPRMENIWEQNPRKLQKAELKNLLHTCNYLHNL